MNSFRSILIVDPDPVSRSALANVLLESPGRYTAQFASDGETAMHIMDVQPIHLLLTELTLPGVDGLEVLDYARKSCPPVPSVVVTDQVEAFKDAAMSLGALAFFTKPFPMATLLGTIDRIFRFKTNTQRVGLTLGNLLQATAAEFGNYVLVVASETEKGKFVFSQGKMQHASCAALIGEPAAFHMLRWRICSFKHYPLDPQEAVPRTVFKDVPTLLIDFAITHDESFLPTRHDARR
jgi:CheY-like chemotaxis protein